MKGILATAIVIASLILIIGLGLSASPIQSNPSTSLVSGSGTTTITFTPGVINHPLGCNSPATATANGLSLLVETTQNPKIGSQICIHVVLTNLNTQPFPVYKYLMVANVTDAAGRLVYHIDWGITPPPSEPNASLSQGQFWEEGVYWNTSNSLVPVSTGIYTIMASVVPFANSSSIPVAIITNRMSVDIST